MAKKIISCWLILLVVLLTGSTALSVGETQAHYINTTAWNTVVEPEGDTVTSNCLVNVSDAPLTVLLGEMTQEEYQVSFTLESIRDVTGSLTWSVDKAEYLGVKMSISGNSLTQSNVIKLTMGATERVTMTLVPTETARTTVHDAMDIDVTVNWNGSLQGTFRVTLPAVTEEMEPTVPDQGEAGGTDVPEENNTDAEDPEWDQGSGTGDSEPTAEPTTESAFTPDNPSQGGETSSEEPSAGDGEQQIQLETISSFAPIAGLPVRLSLAEDVTQVRLGMGTVSDAGIEIRLFPAFTCYSSDNGASYYMLYDENTIVIDPLDRTQVSVLLDFSHVGLTDDAEVILAAEGYVNQSLVGITSASVMPNVDALYQMESRLLTQESSLEITLPESWKDYTFEYSVEMLFVNPATDEEAAAAENAIPEYVDVDLSVWSAPVFDQENNVLTFQLDETLPPAGTYRVSMNWTYEGICFAHTQTTFFINYSVYLESDGTGGTEQ